MAKKLNGSIPFALMFKPTGGQPLDDRVVVAKIADLHDKDTFGDTSYLGMMVVVEEDNNIYVLVDRESYVNGTSRKANSAWKCIGEKTATDLSSLATRVSTLEDKQKTDDYTHTFSGTDTDKIKNFGGFRVIDGTSASFHLSWLNDETVIYFVRTDAGREDGFIYFNGKKYGTGKLSSDKIQTQLTELKNKVTAHIANKANVTATARTSGTTDNGALSGDAEEKWLTGTAIEKIKTYVDSEDVKSMVLTTDNKIQLKNNGNAVLAELDAKSFIKDGMLQSVTLVNDTTKGNVLRFTWNTDGEKTVTDIEVSEFFHEISGDNTTITVTQPASGETGSLQISAKTVANYQDVTSGSTELITAGATALYVGTHLTGARNEMTNTISLSSTKNYVTYASAEIEQFYGTIRQTGSSLVLNVATGLTTEHAGFVYNSDTHTFTAKASSFTIQGLLDAQEVITLLRNNNTNVADALTYLKGQITALSGKMTTVTGELYPVTDIVSELPTTLNVGDRYIVGHDGTFDSSGAVVTHAEYYVVEIAADGTQSVINPLGSFSARVKNRGMKCYMLINDRLVTYDNQLDTDDFILDCGTY